MADLVRGRHHLTNPIWNWLGQPVNATQSDVPVRSNLSYAPGLALTDGAALTAGTTTAVAVPVEYGDVFTKVTILVGATAASTPTHQWAGLYSAPAAQGTPAKVAASADGLSGAIAASAAFSFTLSSAYMANPTDSPQGYLWVAVCVSGTAAPTAASYTLATAVAYPWFTNSPAKMGAITATGGITPTATLASIAAQAVTPVVFLT